MTSSSSIPLVTRSIKPSLHDEDINDLEEDEADAPPQYRLMELPEEIATLIQQEMDKVGSIEAEEASSGKRKRSLLDEGEDKPHLVINGRHGDEAVLCTSDKTFAIREISQSNSLLLCQLQESQEDPSSSSAIASSSTSKPVVLTLQSQVSQLLELIAVVPRLERIVSLLNASQYAGERAERKSSSSDGLAAPRRYTPAEVRSIVQASDEELRKGYEEKRVILLDGYTRLVSSSYLFLLLSSLLLILQSNAYLPDAVPLDDIVQALEEDHADDVRREVLLALLTKWFGRRAEHGSDTTSSAALVALDGEKITRFIGEEMLKKEGVKEPIPLEPFLKRWKSQVGDAFADLVSLDLLRSLHLLHPAPPTAPNPPSQPLSISYFPLSALPLAPAPRFQELFLVRPSWLSTDLEAYIEDLDPIKKKREGLLLRFARSMRVKVPANASSAGKAGEVTVYSARVKY